MKKLYLVSHTDIQHNADLCREFEQAKKRALEDGIPDDGQVIILEITAIHVLSTPEFKPAGLELIG